MPPTIDPLFRNAWLNEQGNQKAVEIAEAFEHVYTRVREIVGPDNTREFALAKTHLEEAAMYCVKSMGQLSQNQVPQSQQQQSGQRKAA